MNYKRLFARITLSLVSVFLIYIAFKDEINKGKIDDVFLCGCLFLGLILCLCNVHSGLIEKLEERIKNLEKNQKK